MLVSHTHDWQVLQGETDRSAAAVVLGSVAGINGRVLGLLGLLAKPAADLLAGDLGLLGGLLLLLLVLVALQGKYAVSWRHNRKQCSSQDTVALCGAHLASAHQLGSHGAMPLPTLHLPALP